MTVQLPVVPLTYEIAGTLTRWHLHPAAWLHHLPDTVSFEEGSLCEPLSVALAGIERAELRLGDPVLIWCDRSY
jgi:L-iditol 2-dehydrogenase